MKRILALAALLTASLAFGQNSVNTPTTPGTIVGLVNNIPKLCSTQNGLAIYCDSKLSDNGTSLFYNGIALVQSTTTAVCASAAAPVAAPCTAYHNSLINLGTAGTTGTVVVTSNAPAGAIFQICPNVFIKTAGTAGNITENVSWTTPNGGIPAPYLFASAALTAGYTALTTCNTVTTAAGSTFSFIIASAGGTGTPSWETEPIVTRLY